MVTVTVSDIENDNLNLTSAIMKDVKKHFPEEGGREVKFFMKNIDLTKFLPVIRITIEGGNK